MAETFRGQNHSIYTSNNGGVEFINSLIEVSLKLNPSGPVKKIRNYLVQLLDSGYGSFSLDPNFDFPNILHNSDALIALSTIIKELAHELTKSTPNLKWDIDWNLETRLKWLARTVEFHEMVNTLLIQKNVPVEHLKPDLAANDRFIFQYYLISDHYKECCKRNPETKGKEKLDLLNKLIPVMVALDKRKDELYLAYSDRSEIFLAQGSRKNAIEDLEKCMALTNDPEEKEFLMESIKILSND